MDEILIGEKKYVSSKQAAKVTGYAKDYIGQLCREGRVPARLVGRSWYVLETAIHDHRFGEEKTEEEIEKAEPESSMFSPTWESPRYEASSAEVLPSINRLQDIEESEEEVSDVSQRLQDSWRDWFDRIATPSIPDVVPQMTKNDSQEPVVEETKKVAEEEEVNVPVHAVYHQPPEELLPPRRHSKASLRSEEGDEEEIKAVRRDYSGLGRRLMTSVQVLGAVFALLVASLAVIGTGYLDTYVISNSQVHLIAGVSLYDR